MSVAVERTGAGLRFGLPHRLFRIGASAVQHVPQAYAYDVTSDGQPFFIARPVARPA